MDLLELKREQLKLSSKIVLQDSFSDIRTIGGATCLQMGEKLVASVVVCEFPSLKMKEHKTAVLTNPLPYKTGYLAYREMPALIDAYNLLDEEPDVLLVKGPGVLHQRRIGLASHLGLALNIPTIGVQDALTFGILEEGKVLVDGEVLGSEIRTREHSNPLYVSPGHNVSVKTALEIVAKTNVYPHKLPEPLHLAHKLGRKITRKTVESGGQE